MPHHRPAVVPAAEVAFENTMLYARCPGHGRILVSYPSPRHSPGRGDDFENTATFAHWSGHFALIKIGVDLTELQYEGPQQAKPKLTI